ncbi:MAG: flagellar hook-basal body complex protein FliE [Maricaulaceae bacterium]|nr:flagellar hook-basal body complex protein FliE [Maricaulaceae bacterium]
MAGELEAIRAYAAASRAAQTAAAGPQDQGVAAPDFAQMVGAAMDRAAETLRTSEAMSAQAALGQADLVDVVTAVAAAEVTLETVIAVRDEVVRAYQDILRMPI